jgi:hypothetical protein
MFPALFLFGERDRSFKWGPCMMVGLSKGLHRGACRASEQARRREPLPMDDTQIATRKFMKNSKAEAVSTLTPAFMLRIARTIRDHSSTLRGGRDNAGNRL